MRNFKEYDFWEDSMSLAKKIYVITKNFPKYDSIISQLQRAVISIPSNIAEGSSRISSTDFARFLEIALGSAYETETQLELSYQLEYINNEQYQQLMDDIHSIEKRISAFIITLRKKTR